MLQNRWLEIAIGFAVFIAGCIIIHDCFDKRGKKLAWPLSAMTPW